MDKSTYQKVALDDVETGYAPYATHSPSSSAVGSPPADHDANRQSIQFAKAAFVFRDRLDGVRAKKRDSSLLSPTPPVTPAAAVEKPGSATPATVAEVDEKAAPEAPEAKLIAYRLRILRLVQSTLTAGLSVVIAVFQIRAYATFQNTKDVPGAWPVHANLLPTILLFVIALLAAAFDLSLLAAYIFPRRAGWLLRFAVSTHTVLTTIKGLSYALTSIVCRGGFNFGNSSGQNDDLWSWTCSAKADAMASVNQADMNCTGQTAAWYIAMTQVGIEALGIVGTTLIQQNTKKKAAARQARSDEFETEFGKVADFGTEFEQSLAEYTPKMPDTATKK